MTAPDATGLMAFWADIDAGYEARFLEWHNCEHMPERVSVPGFVEGRRYHGIGDAPAYLMMYLTAAAVVLESDAYLARLNDPTPWTTESLGHFRNPSRNIYDLRAAAGTGALVAAPYMISIRFDIAASGGDATMTVIGDQLLPAWATIDGVERVAFYAINAAVSGIETAERGIYDGGPGAHHFLLMVECARPEIADGEPWRAAWATISGAVDQVLEERFWIDYVLKATD
jgi:hypothetical protein